MTDQPATPAEAQESPEYDCRLCRWHFTTMDGLLAHIPTHHMTVVWYGALADHDRLTLDLETATRERDALRTAADAMARELDYLWESETHAARTRRVIDQYRALGVRGEVD